jgi:hypothetical protein
VLRHSNSSSESVGDLAYGHGYLRRPKRMVRSRKGKEIDREKHGERERERERYTERYSDREREKSGIGRVTTDAEILAVGAGLAKLARDQNKFDLKNSARNVKQVYAAKEFGRRDDGPSRGLGLSKISHGSDTVDEEGWESASDAESSVDSKLAFGAESQGGWGFFGRKKYTPQSRKNSVVDPRLFGPANSLHGIVTQPVGFSEVYWNSSSDFGQHPYAVPPPESVVSSSQPSMQHVYPIATEDSTRFEAGRSSVASGPEPYISSRPGPIPIQQPQPFTPVSQSVYEPIYGTRSETGTGILKKTPTSSSRGKSLAEAALFGVAGAAVGAAIASDRKDDRKERRRDGDRDTREGDGTPKRRDSEKKENRDDRKRDKKDSPDPDERKEKRRDKERTKDSPDDRNVKKREKRRDDGREETRDERHEKRREARRTERGDDRYDDRRSERSDDRNESRRTKSETSVSQVSVDPFQYQVDDDAFATPNNEPATGHTRVKSVPKVVTVDREPDFTRKRSSSIKNVPVSSKSEPDRRDYADGDERDSRGRDSHRDSRDRPLHEAESIYQQTEHFTAPIEAAAISAAIAAEGYRESRSERRRDERRGERRSDYDDYDYKPRDNESQRDSKDYDDYDRNSRDRYSTRESKRERERDPIQEEADRAYREIVMARKIASQVIRSRTPSPNRSVIDKYEVKEEEEEVVRIVTPPGMDDHKKKGLYDAPNADFQLDHVLEDPREIRRFSLPSSTRDRSNSETLYLKKDPDASQPRPFLNLVLPTPSPSPMPEKQVARSEPARPSKPEVEITTTAASDVVVGPKGGDVIPSSSASTVSKGVTWGENETKHFEVESPSEHRDEFVSGPEITARDTPVKGPKTSARDSPVELPKSNGSKRSGWGAIAAGIVGASAGAAVANSSDNSKISKSPKTKENEKNEDAAYEYRGVVVEPDSPPRSQRQRSPPTTGPKPSSSQTSQFSHIPGSFDDDLDFTATVAAGLQDTGFDPNIVINDPKFRRRDSPPGSNGPGLYHAPYAETVSDLGSVMRDTAPAKDGQGFVVGELATTPKDWPTVSLDEEDTLSKLSKKEKKKREKAKRKSGDFTPVEEDSKSKEIVEEPDSYFETKLSKKEQKKRDKEARRQGSQADDVAPLDERPVATEIVDEPESYFDEPKKKSKKSKQNSSSYDDDAEDASRDGRKVSVPVDAFDDNRNGEDEWSETKKSKRKSKRDSERYDSPSRSVQSDIASPLERTSSLSKRSKDKSKRKSDSYEPEPTEVSLPPSTPSEISRDGDFDDLKSTRKSTSADSVDRGESRSVVSADASRYDDDEPRKSKRKSKSRDDFDDTRSVASAPVGDDYEDKKGKKKDKDKKNSVGFFGLFGSKSDVGPTDDSPKGSKDDFEDIKKKSKKSKRSSMPDASSLYGDSGAQPVGDLSQIASNGNSNGNGAHHFDDDQDRDTWDETRKKSRTREESESSKKDSFLAKAGTLGAGVGLAGAAVAIAAQRHQQSNADNAYKSNETAEHIRSRGSSQSRQMDEILDPEITQRQFRPSIDPQYGDLLPLPPSDPVSPNVDPIDDLPDLPESRPETPEADRLSRERAMASVRKNVYDTTPMKSPSQSAVPLKFMMGNRSNPSSPGAVRSSPLQSPSTPAQESLQFPRFRPRPTSWDSTKEYKPLYLVESNRRGSNVQQQEIEEPLPALPPSQRTSRSSSQQYSSDDATFEDAQQYPRDMEVRFAEPLSINTVLAKASTELPDSQQSTPKARVFQDLDADQSDKQLPGHKSIDIPYSSLPAHRSASPEAEEYHDSFARTAAEAVAGAAIVSSIGYFASSPIQKPTDKSFLDQLPSHSGLQRQPSPVDPMTKDRSSYLLQSSPMSRKTDDDVTVERVEDSPTSRQQPSHLAEDALHSIQERDGNEALEQSSGIQPPIEQEREKTLDTLSGSLHDGSTQETTHDDDKEIIPLQERGAGAIDTREVADPAEDFVFTKSKKDKKKDKKKGRGLRSSTQDDITLPGTSQETFQEPLAPVEAEPADEFSLLQSKKDKKSKLSRSSIQDDFSFEEPSREITDEPSTSADLDPTEEFSMSMSKKDKKKAKKRGKSVTAWEPEEETSVPTADKSFDAAANVNDPEEAIAQDDFVAADTKKGKKDKKNRKSMTSWEAEEEHSSSAQFEEPAQMTSREILETAVPIGLGIAAYRELKPSETPVNSSQHEEGHIAPESQEPKEVNVFGLQGPGKPSEVTMDQPTVPLDALNEPASDFTRDLSPDADRETFRDTSVPEDFTPFTSKKTKKKKGKSLSTWEPEVGQEVAPPPVQETEAADEFVVAGPKKGKTKVKKSQSWNPAEVVLSAQAESGELPSEPTDSRQSSQAKSHEQPVDESDQYATPGWPTTPATPWATANEEFSNSSRTDYFPSAAALHSPAKPQSSDDTKDSGYFPAAATILPVAAAGAAILAANRLDKKADNNVVPETSISRDLQSEPLQSIEPGTDSLPVPDGLKAGYDNDQLSLARQLQEEFGSGRKKSKKDKKKRQSLPATPDLDISRSRDPNEAPEDHHRARSLSIRPSHAERLADRPMNEDRKNVYSEDQLELARQLKAEFEGGNKKSKKDKKKRQGLSRTSTQADPVFDQPTKELQSIEPETIEDVTTRDPIETTRDGFDAGYQEDQLSLARQLQAEFVSGSKESKKDKKRRSTSQTPTHELEPQTDYFGDTAQHLAEDTSRDLEGAEDPGSIILNKKSTRDGLAVGYNEDQLELARQLKEEFSSGSKKSKKDKKKRQSLLRSTTEDDFSSDYPPKDEDESRDIDLQNATITGPGLSEPTPAEAEDVFAFIPKKSKEDKRGKKLESLVPAAIEDEVPLGTITRAVAEVANTEASIGVEPSELPAETPEDEFSLTKKKSKDKKGKKRDSLLRSTTDDTSSSDNFGKAVEALHNTHEDPSEEIGPSGEPDLAPFEDEWSSTPKKSKQSLAAQDDSWDQQAAEGDLTQFQASEEPSTADVTAVSSANEASHETTDDFGFSTKKSKKNKKKRQSLLRSSSTFDEPSEEQIEETSPSQESTHQNIAADPPALTPALADEQGDGFEFTSKKSRKDRKKRQGTQQSFLADEVPRDFDDSLSAKQDPHVIEEPKNEIQEPIVETANPDRASYATNLEDKSLEQPPTEPAEEYPEAQFENFAFTTKKSKKDKKKRKDSSVPESDEPLGVSTPIGPIEEASATIAKPSPPTERIPEKVEASEEPSRRELTESSPAEVGTEDLSVDAADEWGAFSTKTSKKDKKKSKSGVSTPSEEIPLENEIATTKDLADVQEPKEISTPAADPVEDEWDSFTTKRSKKDKKNRKSGLSAPIEDTSMQTETISAQEPIDVEASKDVSERAQDPVEDHWDSFTTKKSKKDKKNKSGLSTPLEEIAPETEIIGERDVAGITEPKLEELEIAVDEEWGSFKTKKSKKDKKKNKSGLSTPLDTALDPEATTSKEIVNEPTPQFEEASAEPDLNSQSKLQDTEELKSKPKEEFDDEWGSFTTKKSKKDKNKNRSGVSTLRETLAETSTTQRDIPQSEEPKSQLEELLAGGTFTTKKSKEEKNISDFSVPPEDASQPEPSSEELQRSVEGPEPQQQEPLVEPETASYQVSRDVLKPETQDPVDEWDTFTTKKSKKGKKGDFGASTPLEREPQPGLTSGEDQVNEEVMPQQVEAAEEEEWGSFTTKKSKKDKKRKSGLSTPIEEIPQPEVTSRQERVERDSTLEGEMLSPEASTQRDLIETEEPQSQFPSTEHDFSNIQADQAPQEVEEPFEFTTKKSKNDKKRKSGLSTPVEEIVPFAELESSHIQSREFHKQESQTSPTEPEAENDQDPTDTPVDFVTKKSKKDKKKRKSGLSTPIEETLPPVEPAYSSRELGFDVPTSQPQPIERDVSEYDSQLLPPETADDGFEFTTKKSKKDKKGKRASRIDSESDPSSSATPSTSNPQVVVSTEDQAHLTSERLTYSPLPVEKELSTEYNVESDLSSKVEREAPVETPLNENDEFPLDLGRKPSQKDKRKRQATVPNMHDGPGASQTPLTSWAVDVEEAEVEREVPVIQDIAKDESLSHIASTTEAAPIDDFSRPTKKGKKGKKRNSGLTRESSMDDSLPAPIVEDLTVQKTAEHSDIPILAATGAALAGAAFLASKPVEDRHEPSKSIDDSETIRKDADMSTPTRKLSKREKRKQSIDRRAPRDDPFDDPTLWEGAEPRAFEESKEKNDDAGSDGFWAATNRDEDVPSEAPLQAPKSLHEGPIDLFAPRSEQIPELAQGGGIHSYPPSDLPRPEEQWNDLPDEYVTTSSKKDKKKRKQSRLAAWETPQDEQESREVYPPISHLPSEPPRARVEEPRVMEHASSERPATPPNNFVEESPVDRDLLFQDDQIRPRSSLRYSRQGSSGLPIVREESSAQMDSEHFQPPSYTHYTDDFNRDSAFVTDSPIPGQKPFSDEHIRDSGVHLRESSPLERTVAPVSTSDDAIARLSWPAVDEASETVDLHRLQRPKVKIPIIQHGDEKRRYVEGHHSHTPHAEDRDSHQSRAMEEDNLGRHHEDRDLLPSQRHKEESRTDLHRTQTLRRSPISEDGRPHRHRVHRSHEPEDEKPHRHAEERYSSSQGHDEEEKPPRHRVHRSHEPEKGKSDKHQGEDRSHPLQSHKGESPSDLHRTQTIHRSQPDSLVKQRVQRIESPDFHRSHTSKEDKYGDLNPSQRPKAEKPKTTNDNAIGFAAAIAGATVGFAAARQTSIENRPGSGQSQRSSSNINRLRTPDPKTLRPESVGTNRSSGTPPLRRSDRRSGDLRSLSQRSNLDLAKEAELAAITAAAAEASTTAPPANPQANEGRVRAKEMADVYVSQR